MKKILMMTAALLASTAAFADDTTATYGQIESELGCSSKATELKKDLIFNKNYRDRWVTWTGVVDDVKGNELWLKTPGSKSISSDFDVDMVAGTDLLQFDKGQMVKVRFQITDYMGCIMPLRGTSGTIVSGG
jgi:hypothetical protein